MRRSRPASARMRGDQLGVGAQPRDRTATAGLRQAPPTAPLLRRSSAASSSATEVVITMSRVWPPERRAPGASGRSIADPRATVHCMSADARGCRSTMRSRASRRAGLNSTRFSTPIAGTRPSARAHDRAVATRSRSEALSLVKNSGVAAGPGRKGFFSHDSATPLQRWPCALAQARSGLRASRSHRRRGSPFPWR